MVYSGFPLTKHPSGRWSKKIRQRVHYFGRWGRKSGDEIVQVEDFEGAAAAALAEFQRQWPYLQAGRLPPAAVSGGGCTVRDLCNQFLTAKQNRVGSGELSLHSFSEYRRTSERIIAHFGLERRVGDLAPDDFEGFRKALSKDCGPVTLKSKINRARVVFKFASDNRLVERPVDFGQSFDRPSAKVLRTARHEAGEKLFSREELWLILGALEGQPELRAMVLLGLNGGFGNTDVASLPQSAVAPGWITFPRPKTGVQRRVPLWPETEEALHLAVSRRPSAKEPADAGLCFLTERGTRFVRIQESKTTEGRHVVINSLSRRFESLLVALQINGRRGRNFYTLRHVFETVAGDCRDQVAVDAIMGHADQSMAANYRQKINDERLRDAVNMVRRWLWGT